MARLRITIRGELGNISVRSLITTVSTSLKMLKDWDAALSNQGRETLDWVVTDLHRGSLVLEMAPKSRSPERNIGPQVVSMFTRGLRQIEQQGTTPPYLSEAGMASAKKMLRLIGRDGTAGFQIEGTEEEPVEITARAAANIAQLLPVSYKALGSVEGRLETITVHGGSKFVVYHSRTRKAVNCKFDPGRWMEEVKQAMGNRVSAMGLVYFNARGEPLRVDLEQMRVLREGGELPQPGDLYGIDPEFTGRQTTEEYLREMRGG